MFGYIRKRKLLEEIWYLINFEKKCVDKCISKIEKYKDQIDSETYDKHVRWSLEHEQSIIESDPIIEDALLHGLVSEYNWNLAHYQASRTFANRLKNRLGL